MPDPVNLRTVSTGLNLSLNFEPTSPITADTIVYHMPGPNSIMVELNGEINNLSVEALLDKLGKNRDKDIWIRINSVGGDGFAGLHFIQAVEDMKIHTTCVVDFLAASMAAYVLQTCDTRLMTERSSIMFHQGHMQVMGTVNDVRSGADSIEAVENGLISIAAKRMGLTHKDFKAKIEGHEYWLSYLNASEANVIDGFADPKNLPPLDKIEPQNLLNILLGGR